MTPMDSRLAIEYAERYERGAEHERDEAKRWRGESEVWYEQSVGKAEVYDSVARDMRLLAKQLDRLTHVVVPVSVTDLQDEDLGYAAEVRIGYGRYTGFGKTPSEAVQDLQDKLPNK